MGTNNVVFLENIEWMDAKGTDMIYRIPEQGSGEIKFGAQLTVRESQAAVFFYQGKAVEAFSAGRHTLKTANIPILTKLLSIPWGMQSPLRAEVYFANMKIFAGLKWGTRDPVAYRDAELGLVRLRAFGVFNVQIAQPLLFINTMVGTRGLLSTEEVETYLSQVIVSRFNDYMGETIDTILDLPARYEELASGLCERLRSDFADFGLQLPHLYINSITPPPEVQKAIDDRSRLGMFDDMQKLMQMKAAMAMETAAGATGEASAGMGAGMGLMMPAMFARYMTESQPTSPKEAQAETTTCQECRATIPLEAKFCHLCGHQQLIYTRCVQCHKNLPPHAKFCSRCGAPADAPPKAMVCGKCQSENLADAQFCNSCGEKLT